MSDRALTIDSSSPPGLRHDRTPANIRQFDKILFQHIYKTGGTSINNMLSNFLTQRELNPGNRKRITGGGLFLHQRPSVHFTI